MNILNIYRCTGWYCKINKDMETADVKTRKLLTIHRNFHPKQYSKAAYQPHGRWVI